MNYLDLFSGIGGFALGAYWAGMKFENHFCSDIEPYPVELYKLRFPDSIQLGDITKIDFEKLKKDYPGEWILTGGFPCQDISVAGKGKGLIDENGNKTRSGLWFEYWRAIRILRPRFVIIENVRALLNRGLETVLSNLAEIGYNAEWQDLQARYFGAHHKRSRIFICAHPEEIGRKSTKQHLQKRINFKNDFWSNSKFSTILDAEKIRYETDTDYSRIFDGIPERMEQFAGLGNAIVPQIAELLFNQIKVLTNDFNVI